LAGVRCRDLVAELRERYEKRIVLFDLPRVLTTDDALAFAPHAECGLMVAVEGRTRRHDRGRASDLIHKTPIVGTVLYRAADVPNEHCAATMYERHFGLTAKPFALTPDPAFLYPSRQHGMALTMLEYGLESQAAFSLLTGEIGSGKTTLVRKLVRQLGERTTVGLISNTHARFRAIHGWALSALGAAPPPGDSDIALYEALVDHVVKEYSRGRRTLLILDEAQNLSVESLEELRLLSNVNSEKDLVLQILLVGQPELRETLLRPELQQFAQRVSVDYHLKALDANETAAYVRHRLEVAGGDPLLFRPEALALIHTRTRGVPRLINQLCDYALVYAYAEGLHDIDMQLISQVVSDRRGGVALGGLAVELRPKPLSMNDAS
jgi:general secretion pathway protein A